jgi:Mn2+/Fe2+ NRAMP family transporter
MPYEDDEVDKQNSVNPYLLDRAHIQEPPKSVLGALRHLGPSLIVTANVVGSGELIMTTTLGAKAGYVTLWVVLISCLVKVAIQLEFGKLALSTGETTLEAMNKLPGPRWYGICWSMWIWFGVKIVQFIQYGGIVGGVALALHVAIPSVDVWLWTCLAALACALLVFRGSYPFIEKTAITLTAVFSLFTVFCVLVLQKTSYAISLADVGEGLSFRLPAAALGIALAAFGITGISADEIISYPYWCLEKGYARFAGPREASETWVRRAKGWIRVMYLDAFLSMVIYTLATASFYVLGAAVLHGRGEVPAGNKMIETLSQIYTESVGPGAMYVFLIGAVVVLFSTLFVASASSTRMFTDAFAQCGVMDFSNVRQRERWFKVLAWFFPVSWALLFLAFRAPVFMVMAGALSITVLLLLVVYAAYVFRYKWLDKDLQPGRLYDLLLWIGFAAIAGVGVRSVVTLFD